MSRSTIKVKGYRRSGFDEDLMAFLRAYSPDGPHLATEHDGIVRIHLDPERFARSIVAADTASPTSFVVALLIECALNKTAAHAELRYEHAVRPFVTLAHGGPVVDAFGPFLRDLFQQSCPRRASLVEAARQLALEWARRSAVIFEDGFALHVLRQLAGPPPRSNPFQEGFQKAFEEFEAEGNEPMQD